MNEKEISRIIRLIYGIFLVFGGVLFGALLLWDIDNIIMDHFGWFIYGMFIAVVLVVLGFYELEKKEDS